jgi:hypothetical protein
VPRGTMKLKRKEFADLKQGGMTVNEYLNSFIQFGLASRSLTSFSSHSR